MADNNTNVYSQDAEPEKKKKPIKLILILIGVGLFVTLLIVANVSKAKEAKVAEESASMAAMETEPVTEAQLSDAEIEQQALIEVYGEPPAGFRWNDDGEPIAVSDEGLTAEEVVYQYLRAVSLLDMANAEKYAQLSMIVNKYDSYYSDVDASQDYYTQFARKMYSQALTSMEIESTEREAVFANGRRIYTMNLKVLDLSYKDFWKDNSEEIFEHLYQYITLENDSIKAQQYIYDQILAYYAKDDAKKRDIQVDIVLDKVTLGGWLVEDDADLDTACSYTDGTSVYEYIMDQYTDWVEEKQSKEDEAARDTE